MRPCKHRKKLLYRFHKMFVKNTHESKRHSRQRVYMSSVEQGLPLTLATFFVLKNIKSQRQTLFHKTSDIF